MTETDAQKAAPISSADILEELKFLRQREGLHLRKLREHCPKLQSLPVTMDEIHRRGLDASDRHVAAHEILKCAIRELVTHPPYTLILYKTLNLGGIEQDLDYRRKQLRTAELFVTDKQYRKLEDDAYLQLAGALVAATRSPCSDDPSVSQNFYAVMADTPDRKFRLIGILIPLAATTEFGVRNELATEFMALLPGARAALSGEMLAPEEPSWDVSSDTPNPQGSPWNLARDLLDAVLMNAWPPAEHSTTEEPTLLSAESLADLLLSEEGDVAVNHAEAAAREQSRFPGKSFVVGEERIASDEFLELKEDSLSRLAELIERIERANTWAEILPGSRLGANR